MTVGDEPPSDRELTDRAGAILRGRLPTGWNLVLSPTVESFRGADAVYHLKNATGAATDIVIEAKQTVESRDVPALAARLREMVAERPNSIGLLVARYLSGPVRERLAREDLAYLDATGNVRLTLSRPDLGLFITDRGADKDPWRGRGRPPGTLKGLKGSPAARVVRALIDVDCRWRVTDLISAADVSTGAAYRLLEFLEESALIRREDSRIFVDSWQDLLRRWSRDYEFAQNNTTSRWLAPRGLENLLNRIKGGPEFNYAITSTVAAAEWHAYAPARSAMIYATNPALVATRWDLRPVDAGANVVIAEPFDRVVFARSRTASNGQYRIAAPAQVAVDLLTGPGRNPSEGEELIEWMTRNESSWRQQC